MTLTATITTQGNGYHIDCFCRVEMKARLIVIPAIEEAQVAKTQLATQGVKAKSLACLFMSGQNCLSLLITTTVVGLLQQRPFFVMTGSLYVSSSGQLYSMLEEMKSMRFVKNVAFAEIIKLVHTGQVNFLKVQPDNYRPNR
jgi:hypothetical protein